MEHIRGRARGLSVFVLADMWAQPMIKLDHLYNLLQCTTWNNYSYRYFLRLPGTPLPIIRIKKRTCTPSTVVTADIAAAVIQCITQLYPRTIPVRGSMWGGGPRSGRSSILTPNLGCADGGLSRAYIDKG